MLSILQSPSSSQDEMAWACNLAYRQLCRKLLPLLVRVFREMRERDGGLAAEFERIAYWDDHERANVTHGVLLAEIPDLIWLVDLVLSLKGRRFSIVTGNLFSPMEVPCVFFDPYMFVGDLFKCIVRQWKLSSAPNTKLESRLSNIIELNTLFQDCLTELIDQAIPLRLEDRKTFSKLEQEHAVLWSDVKLRHYIRHRPEWLKHLKLRHENDKVESMLPRDLHVWSQSTTVMKAAVDEMAKWTLALNKLRLSSAMLAAKGKKQHKELDTAEHDNIDPPREDREEKTEKEEKAVDHNDSSSEDDDQHKPVRPSASSSSSSVRQQPPPPAPSSSGKKKMSWQRKAENMILGRPSTLS